MLTKECKSEIVNKFAKSEKDTGSAKIQIALIAKRISQIAEHLKSFPKDTHSRTGLVNLVGKKRRLGKYLLKKDKAGYTDLMSQLKTK